MGTQNTLRNRQQWQPGHQESNNPAHLQAPAQPVQELSAAWALEFIALPPPLGIDDLALECTGPPSALEFPGPSAQPDTGSPVKPDPGPPALPEPGTPAQPDPGPLAPKTPPQVGLATSDTPSYRPGVAAWPAKTWGPWSR
ncbi:hypothetical protein UPYG_G00085920 [Umbra pygmaea]|uniref:Uncharacterized protein n=1 Tax=Umbra pygmaea TaxID=75934 RepID=A0ABD0XZ40_UMBPY